MRSRISSVFRQRVRGKPGYFDPSDWSEASEMESAENIAPVARRSRIHRSKISNGTLMLRGIDGRSAEARRYRDLLESYSAEFGPAAQTEPVMALIRQAAGLTVQAEGMQAAIVRGEAIDVEQLVRVTNALARTLNALRSRRKPKRQPTLAEKIMGAAL
jgi:hypothetical protein